MAVATTLAGDRPRLPAIHPLVVRVTHWVNAAATVVMITSGWRIYNAAPLFPFTFPEAATLGGWLGGALQWHFAAMWALGINGLVYLAYGVRSGRFRYRLLPIRPRAVWRDALAALRGDLGHADPSVYNAVQKLLYAGVIGAAIVVVASGLAIWKPVQFPVLNWLFGDYENGRLVHFAAMAAIVLFLAVHVVMALLVPRSPLAKIRGR